MLNLHSHFILSPNVCTIYLHNHDYIWEQFNQVWEKTVFQGLAIAFVYLNVFLFVCLILIVQEESSFFLNFDFFPHLTFPTNYTVTAAKRTAVNFTAATELSPFLSL